MPVTSPPATTRRARRTPGLRAVGPALLALVALAGCGSSTSGAGSAGSSFSGAATVTGTINVYAAASLQEAFTSLGASFEKAHPGTKVVFNFGPSSGLATQIIEGAPADVFASASPTNMDQVVKAGDAAAPTDFAANTMEIAVPPSNPAHVTTLADLARPSVKVAVCQPQVPCGVVARTVFANAGITVTPATDETDVKAVLTKVSLNEVDAGIVYVTDVRAAGSSVTGIPIPADVNASTAYPIATLTHSSNRATAEAFTAEVLSAQGSAVLARSGFAKP